MERKLFITEDGSPSFIIRATNIMYHSRHGAMQESLHVYIKAGLQAATTNEVLHIFEMGFGSGLNAFLTAKYAVEHEQKINYTAVDLFPLTGMETEELLGCPLFNNSADEKLMTDLHKSEWNIDAEISNFFTLKKVKADISDYLLPTPINVVYFDAFDPNAQPELWTIEIFTKLYNAMVVGGILTTYCSKGQVRRNMLAAGFLVEKLPGPPGKREIIRAFKK